MRIRNLLIVRSSRAAANMVKRYLLAENSDLSFVEADSGKNALELVAKTHFEIILSEADLLDMDGLTLHKKLGEVELNKDTPFVMLAPMDVFKPAYVEALKKEGIEHYLGVPFAQRTIVDKVNTVCNPRSWRVNDRFHIPNAKAGLHVGPLELDIKLINISMGGILCEFMYNDQPIDFLGLNQVSVYVPAPNGAIEIKEISCKLSRMSVIEWNKHRRAEKMILTWLFVDLSKENKNLIEQTLQMAKELDLVDLKDYN